jgi:hypothetical protein
MLNVAMFPTWVNASTTLYWATPRRSDEKTHDHPDGIRIALILPISSRFVVENYHSQKDKSRMGRANHS